MSKKKKYKVIGGDDTVELFKIPKTLYESLCEESANGKVLINDMITGAKIVWHAERAAVELINKVSSTSNPEAKKFWIDRLEAMMRVNGLNSKMRDRFMLLESEFRKQYEINSHLLDRLKELEDKLSKYETI